MKLSIIVPVFNEEKTVGEIIKKISLASLSIEKEIIIVNDGSIDNTEKIIKKLESQYKFILLKHDKNQGKGAAIISGLARATGEFVIMQDADLEYNPEDYQKLLDPLIAGKTQVVYGSRNLKKNKRANTTFYLGGKLVTFVANLLYGLNITDEPTCYKVFKRDILNSLHLRSRGFEFCPEVTAKISKRGIKIIEIPISYNPRSKLDGKKIKWEDGLKAVWTLIKYKFKND